MKNHQKYKEYYAEYRKKNREKYLQRYKDYNKTRPTARKNFVGIKLDNKLFVFRSKRGINFIKLTKDDIQSMDNIVMV